MQKKLSSRTAILITVTIICIVIFDQIAKFYISKLLPLGQSYPSQGLIRFTHVTNTGASFGLFNGQSTILAISSILIIILILGIIILNSITSKTSIIAAGLIIGGALGNLIDRLRLGYIIDFIDVKLWDNFHWPVFNIADSSIVIGTFLFVLYFYISYRKSQDNS